MCFNFPAVRATCPHQQAENVREGFKKDRATNNDNKRIIHLRRAASVEKKTLLRGIKSALFALVMYPKPNKSFDPKTNMMKIKKLDIE